MVTEPDRPRRRRTDGFWGKFNRATTLLAVVLAAYSVFQLDDTADESKATSETAARASLEASRAAKDAGEAARKATELTVKLAREGRERRDEDCSIRESKQADDVRALRRLYRYLLGLSPEDLGTDLNKAVLAGVPRAERDARTDDAPDYCDEPGIGEPEPDLKVPRRPKGLSRLTGR